MASISNAKKDDEPKSLQRTWADFDKIKFYTFGPIFGLGVMGMFHPWQVIKTRLQVSGGAMRPLMKEMMRKEGFKSFYKGFGTAAIGNCLTELIYFSTLEYSKEKVLHSMSDSNTSKTTQDTAAHLTGGFAAEVVSNGVIVPFDIVAQRMMIQVTAPLAERTTRSVYRGTLDAVRQIHQKEGVKGFFTGFNASLITLGVEAAIWWGLYAVFKRQIYKATNTKTENPLIHASAGFSAGVLTSLIVNPMDVAKTRIQVQDHIGTTPASAAAPRRYAGFASTIAKIAREEGMRGLYAGVRAKIAFFAPVTAISVTSFEIVKYLSAI